MKTLGEIINMTDEEAIKVLNDACFNELESALNKFLSVSGEECKYGEKELAHIAQNVALVRAYNALKNTTNTTMNKKQIDGGTSDV